MNKKYKIAALTLLALPLLMMNQSMASQNPRPLGSDPRIRHIMFNPNEVYEIKATYGFQTTIEFSGSETIQVASIGDSIAWQVIPVENRLFLKPVEQNPRTNLTVVTNKRTYYFSLSTAGSVGSTYLVRFEYPQNNVLSLGGKPTQSPADYNFRYKLKDNKNSGFLRAFDNGEFTYLQFKSLSDLPAIFWIDSNKNESIVNYRIEGPYVVIERVADRFVFRKGKIVGTLINKTPPLKIKTNS